MYMGTRSLLQHLQQLVLPRKTAKCAVWTLSGGWGELRTEVVDGLRRANGPVAKILVDTIQLEVPLPQLGAHWEAG
jgi:hypothetical protein